MPKIRDNKIIDDPKLHIRVCCNGMGSMLMYEDLRDNIIIDEDMEQAFFWWTDCDMTEMNYCPCCGKPIELYIEPDGEVKDETGDNSKDIA